MPFNLFKGLLNAALVMIFYKPISIALKKFKFSSNEKSSIRINKYTIAVYAGAILCIIVSLLVIFVKLGGVFA